MYENRDIQHIMTPVNVEQLEILFKSVNYNEEVSEYLTTGFKEGFDLGYRGPEEVQQRSENLKFTIGDEIELWNKVMKEVKEKRYAGPFKEIPFKNYIQSPIGLVPKDNGTKTRLIFHLSHPRDKNKGVSVNGYTPENMSTVKYKDFEEAVKLCIKEGKGCHIGKSDMTSAFRHFPIKPKFWKYMVMKAKNPIDKTWYYFIDKCMPFGAAISCAHFQQFSNAIAHIVKKLTQKDNVNYLDDFFFCQLLKYMCNEQIHTFLKVCDQINFPVSMEKTFFGTTKLTFLGLLIDTIAQLICVPTEKIQKARDLITTILGKKSKKITLHQLQQVTGFLNFLAKAVVPGRAFTRRLYNVEERALNKCLKQHHHINITSEMRADLKMWLIFLEHPSIYARKFIDINTNITSKEVNFYTDASANPELGCGGISGSDWYILQWEENFINKNKPSINYLELYAVTIAIILWLEKYKNQQITIFCDNMSVVQMLNKSSSKCKNCMVLIRIIVLQTLTHNVKLKLKHVEGKENKMADFLSRLKYKEFRQEARKQKTKFKNYPADIPTELWPIDKIWLL